MTEIYNHTFRKKWGQNFLVDVNLLKRIIENINLQPEDSILEIGPGEGVLTERILPKVAEMAAVEIDPRLVQHLQNQKKLEKCHILHQDVLLLNLDSLPIPTPVRVIGNIPYNIISPILFWLIAQRGHWIDAFIMVQKELAERLTATVGTKAYGRLSVMVRTFLEIKTCFTIPPEVFIPRPRVHSAIIRLKSRAVPRVPDDRFERFEKIVLAAFSKRRKMLRNSLSGFEISDNIQHEIDFTRRAETLTIEEFVKLCN